MAKCTETAAETGRSMQARVQQQNDLLLFDDAHLQYKPDMH